MDLQQNLERLKGYLLGTWRYRWYGLALSFGLALAGWTLVAMLPDQFKATARVYVDTQSLLRPLLKDIAVSTDTDIRVRQMTKTLLSRPNVEKIAQMADLDLSVVTREEREEMLDELEKKIRLNRVGRSNLYKIHYEQSDPVVAKLVVQSILNLFVESTLRESSSDSEVAREFLEEQILYYEKELVRAEENLAQFKRQHMGSLPSDNLGYYQKLQQVRGLMEEARLETEKARHHQEELDRQLKGEEPSFGLVGEQASGDQGFNPVQRKIYALSEQLAQLRGQYTDEYPNVAALIKQIARLEKEKQETSKLTQHYFEAENINENPVYQELKISYAKASADLASQQAVYEELQQRVENLNAKVDYAIEVEKKLSNLNRDYIINNRNYHALLERREAAKIAKELDDSSQMVKFKVIDPPFVPSEPSGPNRLIFNILVLGLSVLSGIAFSLARSLIRPCVYDSCTLQMITQQPVLEQVPASGASLGILANLYQNKGFILSIMLLFAGFISVNVLQIFSIL